MKRAGFITVVVCLVTICFTSSAQKPGISFGFVDSNATFIQGDQRTNPDSKGCYAGLTFTSRQYLDLMSVMTGVFYERMSSDYDDSRSGIVAFSGNSREQYIGVPVILNCGYNPCPGLRVFAFFGPELQMCLSSKTYNDGRFEDLATDAVINNLESGNDYSRYDCLLGGGVGFEALRHIALKIGYAYGMANRYTGSQDYTCHRSEINIGLSVVL